MVTLNYQTGRQEDQDEYLKRVVDESPFFGYRAPLVPRGLRNEGLFFSPRALYHEEGRRYSEGRMYDRTELRGLPYGESGKKGPQGVPGLAPTPILSS
jgi:hypothetical protein